ncbi:MAG: energy-coupling factor transporter transmembrane protein EcfT [Deltaproteobacteria bacterium]|nr:energy-coupling factor transporter transmembrane protein EcfT [Deltaproteobacteria bacterium]MBM4322205.1 energy-coupling factor transporter transmembrane protein EcfT [Deltaproteobacteria bacterium]MBM4347132.1 energy-coupling factor transporter transmembrane protein EcfT [Deltaproteobacteria bacterium]
MKQSILDPRSKLVLALVAMVLLMTFSQWAFLIISLVILVAFVLSLHLFRPWFNFLKGLGFAVLTFFLIAWLAFDLTTGIISGLRLLTIGVVFFLFFQTTPPEILSNGLLKIGFPYPFTFVLTASMQFIPVLIRRTRNIRDAQRARGIPIEGGLRSILHLPALAGPLLIQSFKFADELAEAMEARGFGISGRRFRYEPRFRWSDWVVVAGSLIALIIALLVKFL